jgi:hypothetical protein
VEFVDAAPNYFATARRYQVTRFRPDFPAFRPIEPDRRYRKRRAQSQRHADRQERRQTNLGQRQEERDMRMGLRSEGAIFLDEQHESEDDRKLPIFR